MLGNFNLDKTYQYLLIALAFLLPLTVFGGNLIIALIVLFWLFSGDYKVKYDDKGLSSRGDQATIAKLNKDEKQF